MAPDEFKAIQNLGDIMASVKEEAAATLHPCQLTWLLKPEPPAKECIPFLDVQDCMVSEYFIVLTFVP